MIALVVIGFAFVAGVVADAFTLAFLLGVLS